MPAFTYTPRESTWTPPTKMFRGELDANDQAVWEPVDMDTYVVPTTGTYNLKVTGFAEPYEEEVAERFREPGKPTTTTKTSLELEIIDGMGEGCRFLWNFVTFSLSMGTIAGGKGNPSHIGRIYHAAVLKGEKPQPGTPMAYDDILNKPFSASVVASDQLDEDGLPKWAKVEATTARPYKPQSKDFDPFARAKAKKQQPAPEANDDNTFDETAADD